MTNLTIINFHGIGTPHSDVPADEVPYWITQDHYHAVLDQVANRKSAGQSIHLTFDDGNKSDLEIGMPGLSERGLNAEFFVLTGRLDDPRYLSPADIAQTISSGFGVGLHGRDHVDWRQCNEDTLVAETIDAKKTLEKISGQPIDTVAIPFGAYNRAVIKHLKNSGFARIFTSDGGQTSANAKIQSRTSVRSDTKAEDIKRLLDNAFSAKQRARRALSAFVRRNVL